MSITIYGSVMSSAMRCHLVLNYLQLEYETIKLKMHEGEHKSEQFLKLNPNGKVPAMIDNENDQNFVLFESFAINDYLANKYDPELLGGSLQDKGLVSQWNYWGAFEAQPPIFGVMFNHRFGGNNAEVELTQRQKAGKVIPVLDTYLAGKTYLVNEKISLADFNLMPIFAAANNYEMLSEAPNIQFWFSNLAKLPSVAKVLAQMNA